MNVILDLTTAVRMLCAMTQMEALYAHVYLDMKGMGQTVPVSYEMHHYTPHT